MLASASYAISLFGPCNGEGISRGFAHSDALHYTYKRYEGLEHMLALLPPGEYEVIWLAVLDCFVVTQRPFHGARIRLAETAMSLAELREVRKVVIHDES